MSGRRIWKPSSLQSMIIADRSLVECVLCVLVYESELLCPCASRTSRWSHLSIHHQIHSKWSERKSM